MICVFVFKTGCGILVEHFEVRVGLMANLMSVLSLVTLGKAHMLVLFNNYYKMKIESSF